MAGVVLDTLVTFHAHKYVFCLLDPINIGGGKALGVCPLLCGFTVHLEISQSEEGSIG